MTFQSRVRGLAGVKTASSEAGGGTARSGMPRFLSRQPSAEAGPAAPRSAARAAMGSVPAGAPRALPVATVPLALPGDAHEREANRAAQQVGAATTSEPAAAASSSAHRGVAPAPAHGPAALLGNQGRALDGATRSFMEQRFGADFGHVRVHTDWQAAQLNRDLRANAFTQGNDIFYGAGRGPGRDQLTAHELAHVVQQSGGSRDGSAIPLTARAGPAPIQCSFAATYMIPGSSSLFEIDLQTREGALAAPPTKSGLDGYLRFVPGIGEPNSSVIGLWQVNSTIDASGADVNAASMPAAQAPRGALGDPGLRTEADPLARHRRRFQDRRAASAERRQSGGARGIGSVAALSPGGRLPRERSASAARRSSRRRAAAASARIRSGRWRATSARMIPPTSARRRCTISRVPAARPTSSPGLSRVRRSAKTRW
jgi:hypothetical protein